MADLAVLKTVLETDTRYDAVVRSGSNSECLRLLSEEDATSVFVYSDVRVAEVLQAAGQSKLEALTPDQRNRLIVLKDEGHIRLSNPAIRAELLAVFGITETQLAFSIPAVRRRSSFAEAADVGIPNLNDVRTVVRQIAKSFIVSTGQI